MAFRSSLLQLGADPSWYHDDNHDGEDEYDDPFYNYEYDDEDEDISQSIGVLDTSARLAAI